MLPRLSLNIRPGRHVARLQVEAEISAAAEEGQPLAGALLVTGGSYINMSRGHQKQASGGVGPGMSGAAMLFVVSVRGTFE
jgi:hypothetical protein